MRNTDTAKTAPTITVRITARGADSMLPDTPGAVDADVYVNGEYLCGVTLGPPEDGRPGLETWGGEPDHWCSDFRALEDLVGETGDLQRTIGEIEALVTQAAGGGRSDRHA